MSEQDALQEKMAQIGARYLARTLGELPQVRALAAEVAAGSPTALKELGRAAHRIHGSGAMFGFAEVSKRARDVEYIAAHLSGEGLDHLCGLSEAAVREKLSSAVVELELATRAAAQAAGIESNGG